MTTPSPPWPVSPRRPRHLKRDLMTPPSVPVDLTRRLETRMLMQSRSGGWCHSSSGGGVGVGTSTSSWFVERFTSLLPPLGALMLAS